MTDEHLTKQFRFDAETAADSPPEWIDALKSRRQRPVVRIKRRRLEPEPAEGSARLADPPTTHVGDERLPRTFRVASPTVNRDRRAGGDRDRDTGNESLAAETTALSEASATGRLRPKRRRDPSQLPSVVNRIVFPPAGSTLVESVANAGDEADVVGAISVKPSPYRTTMHALEELQYTLEDVRRLSEYTFP